MPRSGRGGGGVIPKQGYDFLHEAGAKAVFGLGTGIPEAAKDVLRLIRAVRGRGESGERISRHEFTLPPAGQPERPRPARSGTCSISADLEMCRNAAI